MSCTDLSTYNKNTPDSDWQSVDPATLNRILECNGICGPGHYIDLDNSTIPPSAECRTCSDESTEYESQCSASADIWYRSQRDVNYGRTVSTSSRATWSDINFNSDGVTPSICQLFENQGETGTMDESEVNAGCEILDYYTNSTLPLFDGQLLEIFGNPAGTNDDGSFRYQLGSEYSGTTSEERIIDLREKIHENRGSTIPINPVILNQWRTNWTSIYESPPIPGRSPILPGTGYIKSDLENPASGQGNYTIKHIILQEVYDYEQSLSRQTDSDGIGGYNFQQLFSGSASNSEFESCMNSILESNVSSKTYCNGKTNLEIQGEISQATTILDLQSCHIDYIEDKLKIISTIKLSSAKECMDILNIAEMFSCEEPISTKMLNIAYLVFHIIGLDNLDLSTVHQGSPEYYQLTRIIDRLTPYLKQSIKRVIDISKHYEEQTCGRESTTTHMLERIYTDLFDKSSEISIDINGFDFIPEYLIKGTNFTEFSKIIVFLSFLVMTFLAFGLFIKNIGPSQ